MNRTDLLTDQLFDGNLSEAEAIELENLLATDHDAYARHVAAIRLELVLRGLRHEFEFAERTVAIIEADRIERTTSAVMAALAAHPSRPRRAKRMRLWGSIAVLALVLFVVAWSGHVAPDASTTDQPTQEFARLSSVTGFVELIDPAGTTVAQANQLLHHEHTLQTIGEDSVAVIEFPDRTRVEVHPESIIRFNSDQPGKSNRRLVLVEGRISTVATGQRVVIGAGKTEVETIRGSFSLCSSGLGSARVEANDGDVRLSLGTQASPVVLRQGRAAVVHNEMTPMSIDSSWQIDTQPRGRLDFTALDVGFNPDGQVVAVSAKQWVIWTPETPDPGRTLFPPKVYNDGLAAWLTPDRKAVAMCRVDDRDERIIVREVSSGNERGIIPIRVSEPRFLCVAPDATWVATVSPKPNHRRVRVWDVASGRERFPLDVEQSVTCMAVAPDGRTLAIGVTDQVMLFDLMSGKKVYDLPTRRKGVTAIAFAPDGRNLAIGFNGAVQLWDGPSRKIQRSIEGFERVVSRLTYPPSGDLVAAGTQDGQVWVWSTVTGQRTQVIETGTRGVRSMAFRSDGKLLVTATNKAPVAVWEVKALPDNDGKPDL